MRKNNLALLKIKKVLGICSFIIEINNNNWRFGYKNRTKTGNQLMQFRMSNASISFHNCENITVIPIEPCHRSSSYKIRFYWRFGNLAMDNFICLNLVDDIIFLFKRLQFLSLLCKNLQWLQFLIFFFAKRRFSLLQDHQPLNCILGVFCRDWSVH